MGLKALPVKTAWSHACRAGVVPHHLLAGDLIEEVFSHLPCNKNTILAIVSPDHYLQTRSSELVLTNHDGVALLGDWALEHGVTLASSSARLSIEHGVTVFAPFVKKYCPHSQVIPLVINYRHRQDNLLSLGKQLAQTPDTFLLISSDFSHYGDLATTRENDRQSMQALLNRQGITYQQINNDCPNCWWVLQGFLPQAKFNLLSQSNSYYYSLVKENITSYFTGCFQ